MKLLLYQLVLVIALSLVQVINAFAFIRLNPLRMTTGVKNIGMGTLHMSSENDQDTSISREEKLVKLGYTSDEIDKSNGNVKEQDKQDVKVVVIDDVDPVTLTALGFAAIAINFLVFANMGDVGISGGVARIINFFRN